VLPVRLQVTWSLTGGRSWTYPTSVQLQKISGKWLPKYEPTVIHPKLVTGAVLKTVSTQPKRAEILGADDQVLVTDRAVTLVGLEPSRTQDVEASAQQIAAVTGIDGASLAARAKAAGKDQFVLAITLREDAYQQVRDQLQPIPGAVFQKTELSLPPSPVFARALLGTVGPATADSIKQSKGRVKQGDITGLSGVQLAYDKQLSGTSGITVEEVVPKTSTPITLFSADPVPGKPLKITLDQKIQEAADAALESAPKPAALVAIEVGTGKVLAVANGGPNANGYNRAFLGRYPPGSTFKVVSGLGLLGAGVTPSTKILCPATINVGGRNFKNAESEKFGSVPFLTDFANSCNTAFIGSASKLSAKALSTTAHTLGYGRPNALGVTAFTGQVPTSGDAVQHAAAMIGQGTVLTSPVTVAGASAAVAAGRWSAPRLVLDGSKTPTGTPISAKDDANLKTLMRSVVTSGTGVGLRSVPGEPVYGKTGTAEFGNDDPPKTHAWFTGFQGDVAFAAVVEDGGFGAKAALPLIKNFLTILAGQ
jgi:cell division protein FtsI/penicillin-binding protein 2